MDRTVRRRALCRVRIGEGHQPRTIRCAHQRLNEVVPPARVAAVERLGDDEGLLANSAGEHGAPHHGQTPIVLLHDGVDPSGDARSRGHAPVAVEDDHHRQGLTTDDRAHDRASRVLAEVFSPAPIGGAASRR